MSRYIDADKFKDFMDMTCDAGGLMYPVVREIKEYVKKQIDGQPTADVVEVVRCKDCKFSHHADPNDNHDEYICDWHEQFYAKDSGLLCHSGDYCSYGERREDGRTWEEYEEFYGFTDSEQIYTNGARLISSFRVKQWLDHKNVRGEWIIRNVQDWKGRPTGKKFIKCDQCEEEEIISFGGSPFNFCPNCGADMRPMRPPLDLRDCDHCKHYVTRDGQTGCEKWECEFEKED